jgi:hypothetical protein
MTDVRNDDLTRINSIHDVVPLYRGNGQKPEQQYIGFETEIYLYRKGTDGKPAAATSQECSDLIGKLKERGHTPQLEMASAVEYASRPFRVTETAQLNAEITQAWKDYTQVIRENGLTPSDAALLPFTTLDSAKENLVDRDRARGLVKGMGRFKAPEFLKVTLLCTSTQVSLSYKDPDDLRDLLATGYALNGAIYGLFSNYPAYAEGKEHQRLNTNPRAAFYEAFGKDGGIPDSILTAKDGEDFIRKHAEQVFKTEMLFYYDQQQNLVWPETPVRFEDLKDLGLNTRSNYDLAETFVYTDFKVCNIRDDQGRPTGKRIEARGFDAGELGALAAVPFTHAVLRDPDSRDAVKGLLADYGLLPDQDGWQQRLQLGRYNVAHHRGKYLDVAYGTKPDGTDGNLKEFCRDLGTILKAYVARNPAHAASLAPVIDICETGLTVAEKKARAAPTYAAANALLFSANQNDPQATTPALQTQARAAFKP